MKVNYKDSAEGGNAQVSRNVKKAEQNQREGLEGGPNPSKTGQAIGAAIYMYAVCSLTYCDAKKN